MPKSLQKACSLTFMDNAGVAGIAHVELAPDTAHERGSHCIEEIAA